MDTPNNTMTKLAAMEKGASNINRLIVENLRSYADLNLAVQNFLAAPGDETGAGLDECFANCEKGFESIRAAVATVAVLALGEETADEEDVELTGTDEEEGVRLM